MKKYLLNILLKTLGISLITSLLFLTVLSVIFPTDDANLHFNATAMIYGICVLFNLVMTILSVTIFLNLNHKIRSNKGLSISTFLIFPFFMVLTSIGFTYTDFDKGFWLGIAITLPFLITMIIQSISFQSKKTKTYEL